jgi:hypothetical protein
LRQPEQEDIRAKELSKFDVSVLHDIFRLLRQFHKVQELLSSERMPTLPYVLPAYEALISTLEAKKESKHGVNISHAYDAAINKLRGYLVKARNILAYSLAIGQSSSLILFQY